MHYRITKLQFNPNNFDDMMNHLNSINQEIHSIQGLNVVKAIRISKNEVVAFSEYESEVDMNASAETYKNIMGGMAQEKPHHTFSTTFPISTRKVTGGRCNNGQIVNV